MAKTSRKVWQVRVKAEYEAFVNIEAASGEDAEETVQMLVDNGDVDAVTFAGTLKSGGFTGTAELVGPVDAEPTYPEGRK